MYTPTPESGPAIPKTQTRLQLTTAANSMGMPPAYVRVASSLAAASRTAMHPHNFPCRLAGISSAPSRCNTTLKSAAIHTHAYTFEVIEVPGSCAAATSPS